MSSVTADWLRFFLNSPTLSPLADPMKPSKWGVELEGMDFIFEDTSPEDYGGESVKFFLDGGEAFSIGYDFAGWLIREVAFRQVLYWLLVLGAPYNIDQYLPPGRIGVMDPARWRIQQLAVDCYRFLDLRSGEQFEVERNLLRSFKWEQVWRLVGEILDSRYRRWARSCLPAIPTAPTTSQTVFSAVTAARSESGEIQVSPTQESTDTDISTENEDIPDLAMDGEWDWRKAEIRIQRCAYGRK